MSKQAIQEEPIVFPALYKAVEVVSADSQRLFLRIRSTELISLVTAACFAEIPRSVAGGIGPIMALLCFVTALLLRISGVGEKAEKRWYDARAAAESIKSASWQYMIGGEAYRKSDKDATERFTRFLKAVLKSLPKLNVPASTASLGVTESMQALRQSSRAERRERYMRERVDDQAGWYARKSTWNGKRAKYWQRALIALEAIAILLGLFRALGWFDVDWLGVFAAAAASIGAWHQTKNFSSLSEAYAVTSHDVTLVKNTLTVPSNEDAWAQAVHDAEAAFSREHTMWLARRQGPNLTN
jgi:hypothetical protein